MAAAQRQLVHKQFNSPMGLYSQQNVKETLNRELKAFGADGIEMDDQTGKPLNLANSAVLRAVEEEEQMKCGYKRVAWPPASEERIVREFTPQPQSQFPPQGHSSGGAPTAEVTTAPYQPQYRAPSHDNYQQQQSQPQTHAPQQQNQTFAPQNQYPYQAPQQQPAWAHQQQPAAYQPQQQYQVPSNYQAQAQQPQPQQYTAPSNYQAQAQPQQQYSAPAPSNYQSPSQPQQQYQAPSNYQSFPPQQYPIDSQTNQYNSFSQPQQHPSQDQVDYQRQQLPADYRGGSPGIITLRKETPVSQTPAPVYTSQPAAVSFQGGSNMRGDLKWPPPEYKEAAAIENEERRKLALGPVCRPRKINRDYTPFFAKHALNCTYPSYKVPPGTQHMLS